MTHIINFSIYPTSFVFFFFCSFATCLLFVIVVMLALTFLTAWQTDIATLLLQHNAAVTKQDVNFAYADGNKLLADILSQQLEEQRALAEEAREIDHDSCDWRVKMSQWIETSNAAVDDNNNE